MTSLDTVNTNCKEGSVKKKPEYKDCTICGHRYSNNTKSHHYNSVRHKKGQELLDTEHKVMELEGRVRMLCGTGSEIGEFEKQLILIDNLNKQFIEIDTKLNELLRRIK